MLKKCMTLHVWPKGWHKKVDRRFRVREGVSMEELAREIFKWMNPMGAEWDPEERIFWITTGGTRIRVSEDEIPLGEQVHTVFAETPRCALYFDEPGSSSILHMSLVKQEPDDGGAEIAIVSGRGSLNHWGDVYWGSARVSSEDIIADLFREWTYSPSTSVPAVAASVDRSPVSR